MSLIAQDEIVLPPSADFHVHLRDGAMMETVVPTIRKGGVDTVFVMPNLVPPITTVQQALDYRSRLEKLEPDVKYLMSLYLHPDVTPQVIREAKQAGIAGVKSYPAGVTTNSSSGVVSYEPFYETFAEMERQDLVLNLHGEVPPTDSPTDDTTVLNAEAKFLPKLLELHKAFPKLRIILEHATTAAAVAAVRSCGPTVAATITAHHLFLTVNDVVGNPFHFCKPVAKMPQDRLALLQAVVSGERKFFFGSDSAPHPVHTKIADERRSGESCAAGVFTQPYVTQLVLDALTLAVQKGFIAGEDVTIGLLEGFMGRNGRAFYGLEPTGGARRIVLRRAADCIPPLVVLDEQSERRQDTAEEDGSVVAKRQKLDTQAESKVTVAPFRAGQTTWKLDWT